jgi:hypothetical protein
MGLSGVVAFLFVIEPSVHLTDPGRAGVMPCQSGLSRTSEKRNAMATCPICKSDAEEIKSGFIDGKTFRCAKHGEFQVSDSVFNVPALMDADTSQWETALKNAAWRADPGLRPRILSYDF